MASLISMRVCVSSPTCYIHVWFCRLHVPDYPGDEQVIIYEAIQSAHSDKASSWCTLGADENHQHCAYKPTHGEASGDGWMFNEQKWNSKNFHSLPHKKRNKGGSAKNKVQYTILHSPQHKFWRIWLPEILGRPIIEPWNLKNWEMKYSVLYSCHHQFTRFTFMFKNSQKEFRVCWRTFDSQRAEKKRQTVLRTMKRHATFFRGMFRFWHVNGEYF